MNLEQFKYSRLIEDQLLKENINARFYFNINQYELDIEFNSINLEQMRFLFNLINKLKPELTPFKIYSNMYNKDYSYLYDEKRLLEEQKHINKLKIIFYINEL